MRAMETTLQSGNDLKAAIEGLHGCSATFEECVLVRETFQGQPAWEGSVSVFSVDHPEADTCYAWSSPIEGSERRKFYAVLKKPPVDSPETAVRAAIVADHRASQ